MLVSSGIWLSWPPSSNKATLQACKRQVLGNSRRIPAGFRGRSIGRRGASMFAADLGTPWRCDRHESTTSQFLHSQNGEPREKVSLIVPRRFSSPDLYHSSFRLVHHLQSLYVPRAVYLTEHIRGILDLVEARVHHALLRPRPRPPSYELSVD
jgi:hypothetical protein